MKKLLVILLLFFPVHGAWAEIIYIGCEMKSVESSPPKYEYYTIDETNKRFYRNDIDSKLMGDPYIDKAFKMKNTEFNDRWIQAEIDVLYSPSSKRRDGKTTKITINRLTGYITEKNYHFDEGTPTRKGRWYTGMCEKLDYSKKKI